MSELVTLNPQASEFETMQRQCKLAVTSQLLPDEYRKGNDTERLAKAVVVAMKGRELGIPMMQAFSQIHVIKGKPAISAELMLALIYRAHPEAQINFPQLTNEVCEIEACRPGGKPTTFKFTIEDAKKAQLLGNPTWQKYPRAMLRSRAVTEMARTIFPDAIMGCSYTPEELGAEVDIEGEVTNAPKDVSPQPQAQPEPPKPEPIEVKAKETPKEEKKAAPKPKPEPKNHAEKVPNSDYRITEKQVKRFFAIAYGNNWTNDSIKPAMEKLVNKDSTKDLLKTEYDFLCDFFQKNGPDDVGADNETPFDQLPEPSWDEPIFEGNP